jgi:hypothetical protein
MKKRLISMCLCFLLIISSVMVAYADDGDNGDSPVLYSSYSGNGYSVGEVIFNQKTYDTRMSAGFSSTSGSYTQVYTLAAINVILGTVTVKYDTISYGYVTDKGGSTAVQLTDDNHTARSGYVKCSKGMSQVIEYVNISGSATLVGDNTPTMSVYMSN